MQGNVIRAAKRVSTELYGEIDINTLTYFIQTKGFTVISYSPDENHPVLGWLGLSDYSNTVKAFTYVGPGGRYVFIKNTETHENQLHAMAHEAGHIVLGHIGQGKTYTKTCQEMEAETFVYCLLHCRHVNGPYILKALLGKLYRFTQSIKYGYAI